MSLCNIPPSNKIVPRLIAGTTSKKCIGSTACFPSSVQAPFYKKLCHHFIIYRSEWNCAGIKIVSKIHPSLKTLLYQQNKINCGCINAYTHLGFHIFPCLHPNHQQFLHQSLLPPVASRKLHQCKTQDHCLPSPT